MQSEPASRPLLPTGSTHSGRATAERGKAEQGKTEQATTKQGKTEQGNAEQATPIKKPSQNRRRRLNRNARVQAARVWVSTHSGKSIVHRYAKQWKVDLVCAIRDLQLMGIELDPERVELILEKARRRPHKGRRSGRAAKIKDEPNLRGVYGVDYDDNYAFIAGFTSAGFPYGTTWEEESRMNALAAGQLAMFEEEPPELDVAESESDVDDCPF